MHINKEEKVDIELYKEFPIEHTYDEEGIIRFSITGQKQLTKDIEWLVGKIQDFRLEFIEGNHWTGQIGRYRLVIKELNTLDKYDRRTSKIMQQRGYKVIY